MQLRIENQLSYYFNKNPLCLQNVPGNISEGKWGGGESRYSNLCKHLYFVFKHI